MLPAHDSSTLLRKVRVNKRVIAANLIKWSKNNSPAFPWRENASAYTILVSELLLRKTRADKVAEVFPLFISQFPTTKVLAASPPRKIRKVIYALGRLKRDMKIREVARTIVDKYSGEVPRSERDLFAIFGEQSKYTVNAIRCFAYGERVAVFDVNVNRVLSRLFSIDFGKQPHKNKKAWELAEMLVPESRAREFNWALLDLGRTVCTPDPKCSICPLVNVCDYAKRLKSQRQGQQQGAREFFP